MTYASTSIESDEARLDGPDAHHLVHVIRAGPGRPVVLFGGSGAEFDAEVVAVGRDSVHLAVSARREVDRRLPVAITLVVAACKAQRMDWSDDPAC